MIQVVNFTLKSSIVLIRNEIDSNLLLSAAVSNPCLMEPSSGKEYSNDPVFYGPDGNELTEEESAFLWNATSGPTDNYYDDDEYVAPSILLSDSKLLLIFNYFIVMFGFTEVIRML